MVTVQRQFGGSFGGERFIARLLYSASCIKSPTKLGVDCVVTPDRALELLICEHKIVICSLRLIFVYTNLQNKNSDYLDCPWPDNFIHFAMHYSCEYLAAEQMYKPQI